MKVSILVPCYNVEKYIKQCLDSIIHQTYTNLQIVFVDDGSSDNTLNILNEYASKDSRIEVYHQENQGVATARNVLLSKIKGDFFLFVDSDDWIELDMVEFLINKVKETKSDVVTCGNVINDTPVSSEYNHKILLRNEAIERFLYHIEFRGSLWNKLVKTSLLHNCKFHCGISLGEDALFCWHFLQYADKVLFTNRQLYHYRMNNDSICHGTFGPKKLSAHIAWKQICDETNKWWPQYLQIAQARHCIEDVLLLRDAAHSGYKNKNDIRMLQKSISKLLPMLFQVNITTFRMKCYAILISFSYQFALYF